MLNCLNKLEDEHTYDGGSVLFSNMDSEAEGKKKRRGSLLIVPSMSEVLKFFGFAGPMFLISLARGVSWNITTPAAAMYGTIALAAHQVILNIFFFFTIAGEAVFQTAQAFMPEFQEQRDRVKASGAAEDLLKEANERVQKIAKKILLVAMALGVIQCGLSMIPTYFLPGGFTSDLAVQAQVRKLSGILALCIFPHCATIAIEALLLNSKDVEFLGTWHVIVAVGWAAFLQLQGKLVTKESRIESMWKGMLALQYLRLLIWTVRLTFSGKKLGIHTYSVRPKRRKAPKAQL